MRHRTLHPVAWWLWALALAAAASRTTNPVLLGLILAVVAWVVAARKPDAPWSRAFSGLLKLGLVVIAIRVVVEALFGLRLPGHTIVTLPSIDLPSWMAGVTVGGPVTVEALVGAACDGLRLAVILACVGAANSLASPYRLLRSVPAGLYEAAVAVTVALSFTPQVAMAVGRVRDARRLRGRATAGIAGVRAIALPVLEDALERSITLAASMDSRGFGRHVVTPGRQRAATAATLIGLVALALGAYAVLDAGSPSGAGLPALGIGALAVTAGMVASSRGARTHYRPDLWGLPETVTVASGVAALAALIAAGRLHPGALTQQVQPLAWPQVPLVAVAGIALAALPSMVAPEPDRG
jgi:energy-coupling factor transport system permease protein